MELLSFLYFKKYLPLVMWISEGMVSQVLAYLLDAKFPKVAGTQTSANITAKSAISPKFELEFFAKNKLSTLISKVLYGLERSGRRAPIN
jgi:hypothetical protein